MSLFILILSTICYLSSILIIPTSCSTGLALVAADEFLLYHMPRADNLSHVHFMVITYYYPISILGMATILENVCLR